MLQLTQTDKDFVDQAMIPTAIEGLKEVIDINIDVEITNLISTYKEKVANLIPTLATHEYDKMMKQKMLDDAEKIVQDAVSKWLSAEQIEELKSQQKLQAHQIEAQLIQEAGYMKHLYYYQQLIKWLEKLLPTK